MLVSLEAPALSALKPVGEHGYFRQPGSLRGTRVLGLYSKYHHERFNTTGNQAVWNDQDHRVGGPTRMNAED